MFHVKHSPLNPLKSGPECHNPLLQCVKTPSNCAPKTVFRGHSAALNMVISAKFLMAYARI